jgi:DNA polymerase-1
MARYMFDIECDNLLDKVSRMWVLVATNLDTGATVHFLEGEMGWQELFNKADMVIGHNIIGYDLAVIWKLFQYRVPFTCKVVDTLLMSQILNYRRYGNEGHSLERWGLALDCPKGDFHDWTHYSPEMLIYCTQDVTLNIKIFNKLMSELRNLADQAPNLKSYIQAEHYVAEWQTEAQMLGWPFNREQALILKDRLEVVMKEAYDALMPLLGMKCVAIDKKLGVVEPKRPKWLKNGCYDYHTCNWFGIDPYSGLEEDDLLNEPGHRMVKGEYCRVTFEPMSLDSTDDVKSFLYKNGWVPTEWNKSKKTGERTSPKIIEEDLEFLGGDGKLYKKFLTAKSRLGVLKTWLENVDENGMLHGDSMTIGTPSMRTRHAIIANIPRIDSDWGPEIRALFGVLLGMKFIGADSAGNQARGLAHYLANEEYIDVLLNKDIHTFNAEKAEEVLKNMKVSWDDYLKGIGVKPEDYKMKKRSSAKRILYAFLFGAAGPKLWAYIFGVLDEKKGKKFKSGFEKAVPGFADLKKKLENIYGKTKTYGDGYILSLAGNRIYCDSFHKLLVYLLQAAEKITCSAALMLFVKSMREEGISYRPLIYYHDEIDFMVSEEHAERAAELAVRAFRDGPKLFGVTIMDGTAKIGDNWRECH